MLRGLQFFLYVLVFFLFMIFSILNAVFFPAFVYSIWLLQLLLIEGLSFMIFSFINSDFTFNISGYFVICPSRDKFTIFS